MTAHYDRMIWCHRLKGEPQEKYVLSNKHKNPIYVTMSSNFNFYSWKSQFVVSIVCAHLSHFTFQQILILDTDNPNKNKIMIRFKSWFYLLRGETDVQIYVVLCKKEIAICLTKWSRLKVLKKQHIMSWFKKPLRTGLETNALTSISP